MLVVVAILSLVSGISVSLITNVIRSYHKSSMLTRLQDTSSHVTSFLEERIKGASLIEWGSCTGSNLSLVYNNQSVVFARAVSDNNGHITMSINGAAAQSLTDPHTTNGVNVSELSFVCDSSSGEVSISIVLQQPYALSGRQDQQANLTITKKVIARSVYYN